MAKQLTKDSIKMGYLLPVENLERKLGEKEVYFALKIEKETGEEKWMLFSEKEISSRPIFSVSGFSPKLGKFSEVKLGKKRGIAINIHFCSSFPTSWETKPKDEKILFFSPSVIASGFRRAEKNSEDIPVQPKWRDFLD